MKRPQKVTREDRLSQYARKMYEKEKIGKQWEEELPEDKKKNGKIIRTILNRRLRHDKNLEVPANGGAYRKEAEWRE